MKTIIKAVLVLSLLGSFSASGSSYPARIGGKLSNGLANAVTGIAEIPKTVMITKRKEVLTYAATAGVMIGMVHMVTRTLSCAYDVATFIIPTKPIVRPDYVWQNFDQETTYRSTWQLR